MPADTVAINKQMTRFASHDQLWVFGYGSLIFKADFPYLERRPARIRGWLRRFWQGSHDHRGTPAAPGRVVTLVPQQDAICWGMAYLISQTVLEHLDFREKNGYLRTVAEMTFTDGGQAEGLVYIATADNAAFLGPAPEAEIARQIARSVGPSGPNRDYLLSLAEALRDLGEHDPHVFAIQHHLLALEKCESGFEASACNTVTTGA